MTMNPPHVHVYARVERIWPESTVVIIGGGSSLTKDDVDFVRGKARVIAIKEAAVCRVPGHTAPAPTADLLYSADHKWWTWVQGAPEFKGLKFTIEQSPPVVPWPNVGVLRNTGTEGLEMDPSGLRTGFNSGFQALNLAVHLGAKKCVLLGFDMWTGPSGDQNWFGDHPLHTKTPYPILLQAFQTIVEPLKAAHIEVLNASRFTVLQAFPRVALEEIVW